MHKVLGDRKAIFLFIAPALLIFLVLLLVPIIWSSVYTFFEGSLIKGFDFAGLSNYFAIFSDPDFYNSLWTTIKFTLVVTTGQVFLGLMLSLLFVFYIKKASFLIRTLVFFPVVLPTVAIAQLFSKLFEIAPNYGLINSLLEVLNMEQYIEPWLGQTSTAFWILCIMEIWKAMGFYAVILYAGLMDVPEDVLEAAKIDGAKGWKLTQFIVLPLIKPILISSVIFSLSGTLKVFEQVVALTNGGPGKSTTTLSVYMYQQAFTSGNYGYGSTIALVLLFLTLVITLVVYRVSWKDATK
ncbi:raffinose/stachyose/melibiose transport system permease protein [Gracilibacillus orientalis]|uniref:Raffinose/stachyose/melibiose transport system permease protein n=1 Tax=Gracilibacillus orientalis TaxID=334253 RepID=A0A1I4J044_9BACI|nr:sugar ABC transporter permease [Gracilibacillus orientalis]SFL59627.1 raffinose/stachyose/melibiose transport system permease protein [Gracilibacillus orientalis]